MKKKIKNSTFYHPLKSKEIKHLEWKYWKNKMVPQHPVVNQIYAFYRMRNTLGHCDYRLGFWFSCHLTAERGGCTVRAYPIHGPHIVKTK